MKNKFSIYFEKLTEYQRIVIKYVFNTWMYDKLTPEQKKSDGYVITLFQKNNNLIKNLNSLFSYKLIIGYYQ